MIFRVPVFVAAQKGGSFIARPLFFPAPSARTRFSTASFPSWPAKSPRRSKRRVRPTVTRNARAGRSVPRSRSIDLISRLSCAPSHGEGPLSLRGVSAHGQALAFTPAVPDLWFEVGRKTELKTRPSPCSPTTGELANARMATYFPKPSGLKARRGCRCSNFQ